MELSKQCISLEIAQRMDKLGIKGESLFVWYEHCSLNQIPHIMYVNDPRNFCVSSSQPIPAYTTAELGEMLNRGRITTEWGLNCICRVISGEDVFEADTEANARGLMLCYLIENNLINVTDINK